MSWRRQIAFEWPDRRTAVEDGRWLRLPTELVPGENSPCRVMSEKKRSQRGSRPKASPGRRGGPVLEALARLGDGKLLLIVLLVAIVIRLVYLQDLKQAPFFDHPVGDSRIYHERAVGIAAGDLIGREAYFHSSPLYPYFIGLLYRLFGVHFTLIRAIQFLIGSLNCALVYMLARRMPGGNRAAALLAGLFAAFYGVLVFFDGDLLMITLVLCFTLSSVLLLLKAAGFRPAEAQDAREGRAARSPETLLYFFLSGALLGLAGLGKPNVLLFSPFALIWIFTHFKKGVHLQRWREGILFTLGCCLAVLPITFRNYMVSRDFVLVSSNAGVNFFIGNNAEATGVFLLPPESGLDNLRLYLSSKAAAEKATGQAEMKPSQVSRYWTSKALQFIGERPGDAIRLLFRKFLLFWNRYEIPNHHNFYYIRLHYGRFLKKLIVGFGLIAPLALLGIIQSLRGAATSPVVRLYLGFVLVYMVSLLPFFVTARYRLPVVPFLIVFAAAGVWECISLARRRRLVRLASLALAGVAVFWVTRLHLVDFDFGFTHTVMGTVYSDLATENRERSPEFIGKAIIEYKKALEIRPLSADAHYNLGIAYQRIGYFSGAQQELEAAARLHPGHPYAGKALREVRTSFEDTGDRINPEAIPLSPFEQALQQARKGNILAAKTLYERALEKDPHHAGIYSELGAIYFDRGDYDRAIVLLKRGLRCRPDHFVLNNNIAGAYYRNGDIEKAKRHWERCLEIDPGNESVLRQLRVAEQR